MRLTFLAAEALLQTPLSAHNALLIPWTADALGIWCFISRQTRSMYQIVWGNKINNDELRSIDLEASEMNKTF